MQSNEPKINIKEAIVETIAFFDMFDFPLTGFEIWQYSKIKCQLTEIIDSLEDHSFLNSYRIKECNGFYYIKGKEINIQKRASRYNFSERKLKRAIWISRLFLFIPWIKLVAVGNVIGANNFKNNSDIDLFIITKDKRIWLSRLFCVSTIKLLNLRPRPGKEKDTICLSFFISDSRLNIEDLMINNDDIYFVYWFAGLVPILERNNLYSEFIKENKWIKKYLPNWTPRESNNWRFVNSRENSMVMDVVDLFISGLEPMVSKWQQKILPEPIKTTSNIDTKVVITDKILKFHLNDRREYYRKMHKEKLNHLNEKD